MINNNQSTEYIYDYTEYDYDCLMFCVLCSNCIWPPETLSVTKTTLAMTRHREPSCWITATSFLVKNSCVSYASTIRCPEPCCLAVTRAYVPRVSESWTRVRCVAARSKVTFACVRKTIWPTARWVWRKRAHRPSDRHSPSGFKTVLQTFSAYIRPHP